MEIKLNDFTDLTDDMIFVIDNKGMIKYANKAAEEKLFYTKEQFLAMNLSVILYESDKFIEILDKIINSATDHSMNRMGSDEKVTLSMLKQDMGYQDLILISNDVYLKIMYANFNARRIEREGEDLVMIILRDITLKKSLEIELFRYSENLEMLVEEKTQEIKKKNEMLEKLARTDTLTSLLNIRTFRDMLKFEIEKAGRHTHDPHYESFVVVMIDADHFKYYNDTFGHQVGDEIIRGVGKVLSDSVRKIDTVARYGGDEFIIMLTETNLVSSIKTCLRIRELLKKNLNLLEIIHENSDHKIKKIPKEHELTLSIGVTKHTAGKNMDEVINEADTGLYRSKEAGRNCIHVLHKDEFYKITDDSFDPSLFK